MAPSNDHRSATDKLCERAWQTFSDSIDAAESVATERDCFVAGYAAALAHWPTGVSGDVRSTERVIL